MQNLFNELQKCSDYRTFLRIYLDYRNLSFSDFARAAGFNRGFPADIISGKRRLTVKSAPQFEKALKLPALGKKFFRLLVASEEKDTFPEIDRNRIPFLIEDIQSKNWSASFKSVRLNEPSKLFQSLMEDPECFFYYSATGDPGQGALFSEIETRTQIFGPKLGSKLKKLQDLGLITYKDNRFYPNDLHPFFVAQNQSQLLTKIFKNNSNLAGKKIESRDDVHELFFTSTLCLKKEKIPQLKQALRETLLKFIDETADSNGDRLMRFLVALHF